MYRDFEVENLPVSNTVTFANYGAKVCFFITIKDRDTDLAERFGSILVHTTVQNLIKCKNVYLILGNHDERKDVCPN